MQLDLSRVKVEASVCWKKFLPRWGGRLKTVGVASEKNMKIENKDVFKGHLVGVGDLVVAADDCEDLR